MSAMPSDISITAAAAPEGCLIYAVGDVHGRDDLLEQLLDRIGADAAGVDAERRVVVLLGDYIDRGRNSRRVVDLALDGLPEGFEVICLKGNHEQLLLDFLDRPNALALWLANGGDATCMSYGLDVDALTRTHAAPETWRDELWSALPDAHRRFYSMLAVHACLGDYFFVHAGVRPHIPLERQSEEDCLWIREAFLNSDEDFGKLVVHGHTPGPEPVVRANRIGIDTLAWSSGRLTALRLWRRDRKFLST